MKKILLLLMIIPVTMFAQEFKLAEPDMAKIEAALEENPGESDVYIYFLQNYKAVSGKENVIYYDEASSDEICAFSQKFGNGITYHETSCSESGVVYTITLPKADHNNLELWIEKIHGERPNYNDEYNVWNDDGSLYYPEDEGAGCYYEIKPEKDKTIIEIYCGC